MRFWMLSVAGIALAACSPPVPDSGQGVGFGNYEEYQQEQRARDAQLQQSALPPATALSTETVASGPDGNSSDGSDLAADARAALQGAGSDAETTEPPAIAVDSSGISQENNFDAVGAQRSIESDAEKIARNREQYKVIEAEALPRRTGDGGPNIVAYALTTKHPKGTQVYRRIGVNLDGKAARACGKYASPDLAQSAFLSKGGPQRDRLGLDPDGDGFACAWDPDPFRKAVGG